MGFCLTMTSGLDQMSLDISLYCGEEYKEEVKKGSPDSWIEVGIVANETVICGDPEVESGLTGYACGVQFDLLDAVEAVYSDQIGVIEFEFGPDWIVFEPTSEDAVNVAKSTTYSGLEDSEARLAIDPSAVVTKTAVRIEVLETVQLFIENISEIDPEILNHNTVSELERKLKDVRENTGE